MIRRFRSGRLPRGGYFPARWTTLVPVLFLAVPPVSAQVANGVYVSATVGLTEAFGSHTSAFGANHPTRCDQLLYADPASAPTDAACTAPLTSSLQGSFPFDRNFGAAQSIAVGYATGNLRFEGEFLLRGQTGRGALFDANGAVLIGKDTEWSAIAPPTGDIYNFRSRELFANAYFFHPGSRWTPYLGVGAGLAMLKFGFYMETLRKSLDEGYLEAFGGSRLRPEEAPEWQLAAAGSMTQMDEPVADAVFGYQLLAGLDRTLSEKAALGLKIRWTSLRTASASIPFKLIRSHAPVHADGRTPFVWDFDFADLGYLGASLEMKYGF